MGRIERAKRLEGSTGRWVEAAHLYESVLAGILATAPNSGLPDDKAILVVMVTLALAEIYTRQSQFDPALRMVEMALCYNPTPAQRVAAFVLKGEALCGMGKTEAGVQAFTAAAEQAPVGGRLAAARVMARLVAATPTPGQAPGQRERLQECAEIWSDILVSDDYQKATPEERAEAWTILGLMAQAKGNRPQALDYFKAALSAAPGYAEAARLLAEPPPSPTRVIVPNPPFLKTKPPPCKPLLASATRLLYAHNAFRITALPVDASVRDIVRQADRLKIMAELNQAPAGNVAAFAPCPAASLDEIRDALQRLKGPEERLIDELFWFWPEEFGNSRGDDGLQALARGDEKAALDLWRKKEYAPGAGIAATHNLAVYWHCKALEQENQALAGNGTGGSGQELEAAWSLSLARWNKLAESIPFWELVRNRMRQLDAERLTDSFCESLHGWLLQAIDQASGDLALACAGACHLEDARRQAQRIERAEARRNERGKTAELVLAPAKKRLEQQAAFARSRGQANPEQSPEAARELFDHVREAALLADLFVPPASPWEPQSPANTWKAQLLQPATQACAQLMKLACPRFDLLPRGRLDAFLKRTMPEWRKIEQANQPGLAGLMAGELVGQLTQIGAEAHNIRKDSQTAVEAFELAVEVCSDPVVKKKISTDLETVKRAAQATMCHYCGRAKGDAGAETQIWMWGELVRISYNRTNFKHSKISITRCGSCQSLHRRCLLLVTAAAFCASLLAKMICSAMGSPVGFPFWILAGFASGWLANLWFLKRHRIKDIANFKTFFPVADALKRGWNFGSHPRSHNSYWTPNGIRRALWTVAVIAGAIVAALTLESLPAQWIGYEWALLHNNQSAYEGFLAAYPSSGYADEAKRRLKVMMEPGEWEKVLSAGSDAHTLRTYIASHPDGAHLSEARRLLDGALERNWAMVETNGSLEDVRNFRRASPEFRDDKRVDARLEELLWTKTLAETENNANVKPIRMFLETYPKSRFASDATNRLNDVSERRWTALEGGATAEELSQFILDFRGFPKAEDAQARLNDMLAVRSATSSDLRSRATPSFLVSDLAAERRSIEADQIALEATQLELKTRKQKLDDEHQRVNTFDRAAVNEHNQRVREFNREAQDAKNRQTTLNLRVIKYNEKIRSTSQ
jgi:tetratricopeptide (TPR) repeat protein